VAVKVRIRKTPVEPEVDGIKLDRLAPGAVRDMSASLASWLIVEGYAEPEMRRTAGDFEHREVADVAPEFDMANDRRRRPL
jgi:hypothetical protein